MHQEKESSIIYGIYYKLAANLALEGFYPGKYPVQLSLKQGLKRPWWKNQYAISYRK